MKKVLIFSLAYYPRHVSGAEAAIKEITDRIDDIEFHLVTLRFDAVDLVEEKMGNVLVHRIGNSSYRGKMLFPLTAALKARSLNRTYHFDALWAMMTYMLLPVVLAQAFGVRAPHVLTLQDGDPYKKVFGRARIKPFLWLIDRGFRTAAVIQVISKYLAEWPARRGYAGEVVLVRNGANPNDLKEKFSPEAVEEMRQKLGKKPGEIYLVNTSRLVSQKGFDFTIEALKYLPANIKLLAVGEGEDEPKLKELAHGLGVADRVIFTGRVDRSVVTLYRKVSDIFVAPSRSEGLGNAFLSALASRLPLITTGVGGIADYAVDGETAWIVKPNPKAIADKVTEVLSNPQKAKEISARARHMVEQEYDWDVIARQMREKVFTKALREKV
jgi:glycosyltransferase involved in cell wall biosynthesis